MRAGKLLVPSRGRKEAQHESVWQGAKRQLIALSYLTSCWSSDSPQLPPHPSGRHLGKIPEPLVRLPGVQRDGGASMGCGGLCCH